LSIVDLVFDDSCSAHQVFRGPKVTWEAFCERAAERFYELFDSYRQTPDPFLLRNQLQAVLDRNANNIALVVAQGALAFLARYNALRILERVVEAPEEWFRIVAADDADMFVGGM
jgi:hypothetical protein